MLNDDDEVDDYHLHYNELIIFMWSKVVYKIERKSLIIMMAMIMFLMAMVAINA